MGRQRDDAPDSGSVVKSPSEFNNIFMHRDPVDMRRGILGLSDLVQAASMGDLTGKNLFVFSGRRKDSIKVLYFDRSGFCLWQKKQRIENRDSRFDWGRFSIRSILDYRFSCFFKTLPSRANASFGLRRRGFELF